MIAKLKSLSFIIPAGLFVLSVLYMSQCFSLNFGTLSLPEEGMVPFIFGVLLLLGNFLLMVQVVIEPVDISIMPSKAEVFRVLIFIGALFGFVVILPIVGFSLSTFFLIIGTMKLFGGNIKTSLIVGMSVVIVSYFLFRLWLKVPLPPFGLFQ